MDRYSKIALIVALDFDTKKELDEYRKNHDVRRDTVLKVKPKTNKPSKEQPKQKTQPEQKTQSESQGKAGKLTGKAVHTSDGWRTDTGKPLPPHVASRVIPPKWSNVRYDKNPEADLVVQGYDAKGRLQSKYSDSHQVRVAAAKFSRIGELISKVNEVKKQNARDLADAKKKEDAACIRLIMETGIRPGSDRDTKAKKKAYGATTLCGRHVVKAEDGVRLRFVGKEGIDLDIPVRNEEVAKDLLQRKKASGEEGKLFKTDERSVLEYTHTLDGGGFKTKDMRTMVGTMTAIEEVKKIDPPKSEKEYVAEVKKVGAVVAKRLGNTPVIALQSYISPVVFSAWRQVGWTGGGKNQYMFAGGEGQHSMTSVFGLKADIQFGNGKVLDWRGNSISDETDPDDSEMSNTPKDVIALLGFDPKKVFGGSRTGTE